MEDKNILKIRGTEVNIETTEDLKKGSVFQDEYDHAFLVVQGIINRNMEKKEKEDYRIHNIVPFIGKRGSGKTSVMMSFSGILSRYYEEMMKGTQYHVFKNKDGKEQMVRFECVESIDGSLLEKGEDIFKVILAQMYGDFLKIDRYGRPREKGYEYDKRELQQAFDKVYRSVCKMEQENYGESYYEESSIISLKNLSSSLALTREFGNLVQQYLKIITDENERSGKKSGYVEPFLVITVDDLDLNIHRGYEMLEKLHRYMMVPNVIILLAVDYDQIKLLCERQIYQMVPNFDAKLNEKKADVEKVARDFLDKVFPSNVRIYMPLFENMDSITVNRGELETKKPKESLFKLLYDKLGMRMDTEGSKRHYYEQYSLRTFISFYLMLDKMETVKDNEENFVHNYKLLMSDTINRMVDERLDNKHKHIFNQITKTDLLHAAKNLYIYVAQYAERKDISPNVSGEIDWKDVFERKNLENLANNIRIAGYNYGELMRIIYCWGRVNNECKEMIRCLLAYFSLEFYKCCKNMKSGEKELQVWIARIINGSISGSWSNRMLPEVSIKKSPGRGMGMCTGLDMKQIFSLGSPDDFEWDEENYIKNISPDSIECVYKWIKNILIYAMFFDQSMSKEGKKIQWKFVKKEITENERMVGETEESSTSNFKIEAIGSANFNFLGFVTNAFQYEEKVIPLVRELCEILISQKNKKDIDKIVNKFEGEFKKWYEYSRGFAIPIYNMDITYNLMKRLRQRNSEFRTISAEQYWTEVTDIYKFIYEKLLENDNWYGRQGVEFSEYAKKGKEIKYADTFIRCPYMNWIFNKNRGTLKLIDSQGIGKNFESTFSSIIESVYNTGKTLAKEQEDEYRSYYD